jgi:hypothetical protein
VTPAANDACRRIVSGLPLRINETAIGHRFAFVVSHSRFPKCNGAGGIVQQQGGCPSRENHAKRICSEPAVFSAKRGHHRIATTLTKWMEIKPAAALFGPVTNTSDMMGIVKSSGEAMLSGLFNAQ